jgi:hypothetical protein
MRVKIKYLFAFLLGVFNITFTNAQSLESYYAQMTVLPFFRALTRPPRLTHAQKVAQDSEFERKDVGKDADFAANPLLINGIPLNYDTFDGNTKGILTVVKGNPNSKEAQTIPFYVSIRRNGRILKDEKMSFLKKKLQSVKLSDIFLFTKFDDVLIINPVKAEDWKAKRVLKLLGGC